MPLRSKDFFGLRDMSADDISYILGTAETMKYIMNQKSKKAPHLQGKSVIMLFYEQSARAKLAYELAAKHMSANVIDMTNSVHSIEMESLQDMGPLIDQMGADFIILRHPMAGAPKLLADCVEASVINAGDGFNEDEGTVNEPIGRNPQDRKKMAVTQKHSRHAVTHYRVIERMEKFTLIEAQLETGRTHQIRVHMTYIGHPLLGDPVYGPKKQPIHLEGQALHARVLGFIHPRTGEYMEFEAPLPPHFEALLERLRK